MYTLYRRRAKVSTTMVSYKQAEKDRRGKAIEKGDADDVEVAEVLKKSLLWKNKEHPRVQTNILNSGGKDCHKIFTNENSVQQLKW